MTVRVDQSGQDGATAGVQDLFGGKGTADGDDPTVGDVHRPVEQVGRLTVEDGGVDDGQTH
jgi:hypothetical protein